MKAVFKRNPSAYTPPAIVGPKPKLAVCLTVLEDREETSATIQSILDTSKVVEIVVVDDASNDPVDIKFPGVIYRRNDQRMGVAASRDVAVSIAKSDFTLITDSHMRFTPNWHKNIMDRLGDKNQAWCATCLGLDADNMDINKPKGRYRGADLVLYRANDNTIFEGKWAPTKTGDDYEISCMMGACYFVSKELYGKVLGLGALKQWGSDEPYLSSKIWLAGGSIRLAKSVEIGHKFRKKAPYRSDTWCLHYNKLRAVREVFGPEWYRFIIKKMERHNPNVRLANINLLKDMKEVTKNEAYYLATFPYDWRWLCDKFGIEVHI